MLCLLYSFITWQYFLTLEKYDKILEKQEVIFVKRILPAILLLIILPLAACTSQNYEIKRLKIENKNLKVENEFLRSQLNAKDNQNVNTSENNLDSSQSTSYTSSYETKRKEFAQIIKQSLNAPGLPEMCTDAYFNSKGELIIVVNGEWLVMDKELRNDMIYALKELLRKSKNSLNVEGYGQFFSDSGQPLESFYAD